MSSSGHTIVELLISLAIASLVVIVIGSITILGLRFANHDRYEDQRVYPVRNAFDMIVKDLRTATEVRADCPRDSGLLAFGIVANDGTPVYVNYRRDADSKTLIRTAYHNNQCEGTSTATNIAYQITRLKLESLGGGRFEVEMRATSTNGVEYRLSQRVTGRVLAQP